MKSIKFLILVLTLCVGFALVACNSDNANEDTTNAQNSTETNAEETTESNTWDEITVTTAEETEGESVTETESESVASTDTNSETSSETSSETESETSTETESEETTEPRFDYFAESMEGYITLDKSAYESIDVKVSSDYIVTDEVIDAYIEGMLFNYREKANGGNKATTSPIKRGDSAFIFYKGVMDGKEFEGGSNMNEASPYELVIGSGNFVPGFEDALIGVIPANTSPENMVAINLTFPEDYYEDLAGKDVTFYVYVSWSIEYTIPEYTESFVRDTLKFESHEADIIAAHRASIKASLEAQVAGAIESLKSSTVWNTLIEAANVIKYPEYEVEYYYNYYLSEIEYYHQYYTYMGYKFDSIDDFAVQFLGLEKGAYWKAEITKYAKEDVTQTMIYYYISEVENMPLTDADYEAEITRLIEYYKANQKKEYTREQIIEMLGEDVLKDSALYTKVQNYLFERVNIIYE